jgi:hypothetical protein
MLTLVPEDGTGLANANSYLTLIQADDYFSSHPYYADPWNDLGNLDKNNVLAAATSQLDALFRWRGAVAVATQALGWPRVGAYDDEGRLVSSTIVPRAVRNATCELAIFISRGDAFAPASNTGIDRLKIDVIELQFSQTQNGAPRLNAPVPAAALLALRGLGEYTLGSRTRRVMVG